MSRQENYSRRSTGALYSDTLIRSDFGGNEAGDKFSWNVELLTPRDRLAIRFAATFCLRSCRRFVRFVATITLLLSTNHSSPTMTALAPVIAKSPTQGVKVDASIVAQPFRDEIKAKIQELKNMRIGTQ